MTPEEITALFTAASANFTPIAGNPSDDDLTDMREILLPILLSIPYDETGPHPRHNLVGLIEATGTYTNDWGAAFPIPARPAAYDPAIAADATPVVRARMEAAHTLRLQDYSAHEAAERGTAKFIRDAVDELWYKDLKHHRSFYTNVSAKQLFDHLDANCGGLHPVDLINLPTEMMTYYSISDGIPEYIDKLEDAQRKLARANLPMLDVQLLAIASTAVLAAQHFPRATDEWEAMAPALKTWATWKTTYRAAHIARKRQLLAAGSNEPLSHAHAVTTDRFPPATYDKLDGYLDNLANAATHERSTLAQLVESNATLTANNAALTASLAAISAAYTLLAGTASSNPGTTPATSGRGPRRRTNNSEQKFAPNGYCWTHGFKVGLRHNSATCTNKADGHKDAATRTNTMNGSSINKGWEQA